MSHRAISRFVLAVAGAVALALAGAGCGDEIGDACTLNSDCDSNGNRVCIQQKDGGWPEGYCTILGCDHDTCPEEAVCVRFYTSVFANRGCDPATEDIATDACTIDEACSFEGYCALRSAENRFCMKSCSDSGDCRSGYECRDAALMKAHGGEPVMPPGERVGADPSRFCALKGG